MNVVTSDTNYTFNQLPKKTIKLKRDRFSIENIRNNPQYDMH